MQIRIPRSLPYNARIINFTGPGQVEEQPTMFEPVQSNTGEASHQVPRNNGGRSAHRHLRRTVLLDLPRDMFPSEESYREHVRENTVRRLCGTYHGGISATD